MDKYIDKTYWMATLEPRATPEELEQARKAFAAILDASMKETGTTHRLWSIGESIDVSTWAAYVRPHWYVRLWRAVSFYYWRHRNG